MGRRRRIKMIKPVISYPGAKWKAWSQIKPLIPRDIEDWREPFFGGGSISLLIAEDLEFNLKRMVVGDLAPEVWAFWTGCRDHAEEVTEICKTMFKEHCPTQLELAEISEVSPQYERMYNKAIDEGREFWKWSQDNDNIAKMSIPERAARFFLVNRISFSGMGDAGSISKENFIAFRLHIVSRILEAQPLLQRMEIKNCSFEETMADVDRDKTFIFLDPPYYNQMSSGLYGKGGSTHHGFPHEHFAEFTKNTGCRWLITYDDSIKVRKMFKGSNIREFKLTYTMAGKQAEDALAGEELFIANYDISEGDSDDTMMSL